MKVKIEFEAEIEIFYSLYNEEKIIAFWLSDIMDIIHKTYVAGEVVGELIIPFQFPTITMEY